MKKIAVITATRAEFGLLMPVIKELRKYETSSMCVDLIVTGTHLSKEYGNTIDEIISCGERIDHQIYIPTNSADVADISRNQSQALLAFTELFINKKYIAIVILGDRYEMLSIAIAAGNTHTPIFHLCGGDTTEGAIDEWIRHSITKMSYLHFVTNEESRKRVIQLGEEPQRVFNFGSTSIDNILKRAVLSKESALESIRLPECDYAICTYHPVTMSEEDVEQKVSQFLCAIKNFPQIQFIVTKSNADYGGAQINKLLDMAEKQIKNMHVYSSLGVERYLSLMKYAEFVLGNSSSGIIETPAFQVPTVNIGDRQRGRLQSANIINCGTDSESIVKAIEVACSEEFKRSCKGVVNPYGDGHAAEKIAETIMDTVWDNSIDLKKKFYDIS